MCCRGSVSADQPSLPKSPFPSWSKGSNLERRTGSDWSAGLHESQSTEYAMSQFNSSPLYQPFARGSDCCRSRGSRGSSSSRRVLYFKLRLPCPRENLLQSSLQGQGAMRSRKQTKSMERLINRGLDLLPSFYRQRYGPWLASRGLCWTPS